MKVRDFMKADIMTVDSKTPIMDALAIMKERRIKRLPVMKKHRLEGLVTRSMIRDASPSGATSLSVYELHYLISKMTVGDIMVKKPICVSPDMPVEEAIWLGKEKGIGAFPVVDNGKLVGIITESDISGQVSKALGLGEEDSKRLTIEPSGKKFGFLKDIIETLDRHNIMILSIMSVFKDDKNEWALIVRVKTEDADKAVEDLKQKKFKIADVS
jgi:acetoin utilization protein AcuB